MKILDWIRRSKRNKFILLSVLLVIILIASRDTTEEVPKSEVVTERTAKVATANSLLSSETSTLIGTVRPLSAVAITPDRGGRVTRVNTSLGARVSPGQVIVELENASERAVLLQAEGAYEAAVAQRSVSGIGLSEAEARLRSAVTSGVNAGLATDSTITDVVRNTIDTIFSDPNSQIPGLRLDARSDTTRLNQERVLFATWLRDSSSLSLSGSDADQTLTALNLQAERVSRLISFVDSIVPLLADQRSVRGFSTNEVSQLQVQFNAARNQLVGARNNLNNAKAQIEAAVDGVRRASILADGGQVSQSEAQIKQALGSLRAAQANFEKTLLRSPISGTVNSLNVRVGDFVSAFTPLAEVANNAALEVVTFVSDAERARLSVGQSVQVGSATGTITAIAPAVDSDTRRIEVRIGVISSAITVGDTVRVVIDGTSQVTNNNSSDSVIVPLTALKLSNASQAVLMVSEGKVLSQPVEIGVIRGGRVEIISGLSPDEEFIVDARRFKEGDEVNVIR